MDASVTSVTETHLNVRLRRGISGLLMTVQASEAFEEFMKGLGDGSEVNVLKNGKAWTPLPGQDLFVWQANGDVINQMSGGNKYRLDYIGRALDLSNDYYAGCINLTFLRLVGISKPEGVTFMLKNQLYSVEALRDLKDTIGKCAKNLYTEFVRPVDFSVQLTQVRSKEILL